MPGIVLVFVVLFLGAVLHSPWLAALILVLFPGGLAAGLHLEVAKLTEPDPWHEAQRMILTVLLALVFAGYAQS